MVASVISSAGGRSAIEGQGRLSRGRRGRGLGLGQRAAVGDDGGDGGRLLVGLVGLGGRGVQAPLGLQGLLNLCPKVLGVTLSSKR